MKTLRWAALAAVTLASPAALAGDFNVPTVSVYGAIGVGFGDTAIKPRLL
jgi:hypothetical protein